MDKNLKRLMLKNIEAAHEVYSNYESLLDLFKETMEKFVQEIKKEIKDKEPVSSNPDDWELELYDEEPIGGLKIKNKKWTDDYPLQIIIEGHDKYKNLYYGVSARKEHFAKIKKKLNRIEKHGVKSSNEAGWPFYTFIAEWKTNPTQIKILLKKERTKLVKEIACKLVELMDFCDKKLLPSENRNS